MASSISSVPIAVYAITWIIAVLRPLPPQAASRTSSGISMPSKPT